jgi:uncharacterized membrane protein YcfT
MAKSVSQTGRVDWVDYAKGICIIFVVMMHSTLGVEEALGRTGFMHAVVAFAKPFRMPDFFLISGLFLGLVIDRDWRTYLDRKVVHFAYFYLVWVTIQFAFKAPGLAQTTGWAGVLALYLESFVEPFGTLWFIYLLPIFFVVTKLARPLPPLMIFVVAAVLQSAPIDTGWIVIDEFCHRFVFFFAGYWLAPRVFEMAADAARRPRVTSLGLGFWACIEALLVWTGHAGWPLVSLLLGFAGAFAVISVAALLAQVRLFAAVRWLGEHSIVVYLAFFLPMAVARTLLLRFGVVTDAGVIALLVTASGVLGAVLIYFMARAAGASFLFERPDRFWIAPRRLVLQPAE